MGIASSRLGFAFAVTEGPRLLVRSGSRIVPVSAERMTNRLAAVIRLNRPLFVAVAASPSKGLRDRGRMLNQAIYAACQRCGVMCLTVRTQDLAALTSLRNPTRWRIAEATAKLFPHLSHKLPAPRRSWMPEDKRVSLFLALAVAVCAWDGFRKGRW